MPSLDGRGHRSIPRQHKAAVSVRALDVLLARGRASNLPSTRARTDVHARDGGNDGWHAAAACVFTRRDRHRGRGFQGRERRIGGCDRGGRQRGHRQRGHHAPHDGGGQESADVRQGAAQREGLHRPAIAERVHCAHVCMPVCGLSVYGVRADPARCISQPVHLRRGRLCTHLCGRRRAHGGRQGASRRQSGRDACNL